MIEGLLICTLALLAWVSFKYFILIRATNYAIKEAVDEIIDSLYPCSLVLTARYNQIEDRIIADFSNYEKMGVVMLTSDNTGPPQTEEEAMVDGKMATFQRALVYKIGDIWNWKTL